MTLHLRKYISVPYVPGVGLCICSDCICEKVTDCFVHICDCCLTDNGCPECGCEYCLEGNCCGGFEDEYK